MRMTAGRVFDWIFRDRVTGRVVVGQWPNLPLWLFGLASLAAMALSGSSAGFWADIASRLALAWWAGDEFFRGVNPWRRCLGFAVLLAILVRLAL